MREDSPIRILLLSDFSREPERQLLRGVMDYASEHGGCIFFPLQEFMFDDPSYSTYVINRAKEVGADAIFGRWGGIDEQAVRRLGIPVILRTSRKNYPNLPMLSGDYRKIGLMAAEYFRKQHYVSYAYFGRKGLIWSEQRAEGFRSALEGIGVQYSELWIERIGDDWDKVVSWLEGLPKPVALFAENDLMARPICEICSDRGIAVPQEVAVLGVDDDEFTCNITYPSLSSIHMDFRRQGQELGQAIFRMVAEGRTYPVRIPIHPTVITERGSTLRHNIADPVVSRVLDYIDANYLSYIDVEDIVKQIPLTRRAIEMRFRAAMEPDTIHSYLTSCRINHLCMLLRTTSRPVSVLAQESGFKDSLNIGRTFRQYMGMSPNEYRAIYQ